jgi:23S rRNA G2445 N2-methylase RlmL
VSGFDLSDDALEVAQKIKSLRAEFAKVQIAKQDLFDSSARQNHQGEQTWLIANFPYGVRLDTFDVQKAYESLKSNWHHQRMLLVMSHEQADKLIVKDIENGNFEWIHFNNQGIHCRALFIKKISDRLQ